MKRRHRNRIAFAIALAFALFFIDSSARLILVLSAPHLAPLPHIAEQLDFGWSDEGYVAIADHTGPMFHIRDNLRLTIGQPQPYTRTVWVFGNSGAFGMNVTDGETMESQLQDMLNRSGYRWRVVNAAAPGEHISGELARLRSLPIQRGDVVAFDDGTMDLVVDRCEDDRFAVLQLACQVSYTDFNANAPAVRHYENVAENARRYAVSRGATFYHFVEPTPYTQFVAGADGIHLTAPDDMLSDASHLTPNGERIEARQIFDTLTLI